MKQFFIYVFICLSLVVKAQKIAKINVFHIQRGGFRYIGIDEGNIRASATSKFTINDPVCLNKIDSLMQGGKEIKQNLKLSAIFMLCEIIYAHGVHKLLLFEDRVNGDLQFGSKLFKNIMGLEGVIFFCKTQADSLFVN